MNRIVLILVILSIAAAPPQPTPLVILKGGTYVGNFASVTIAGTDGKLINIGDPNLKVATSIAGNITQTTSAPIYLSVNNCWIKAPPGKQAIQLWRVTHLYINHNDITSGGIMVSNYGSAIDGSISFNSLHDIDGTVAPGVVQKMAAISWQFWAGVPHISAWNSVVNAKGVMEDGISNMLSTGKSLAAGEQASFHNNLIVGCATGSQSGSGFMIFDPGSVQPGDPRAQGPCNALCANNIAVGIRNQAITAAGGNTYQVVNNIAVNDGSHCPNPEWGYELWNWDNKTDPANFGKDVTVTGNESWVLSNGKPRNYSFTPPITGTNNTVNPMTDAYAIQLFQTRVEQNKIVVGPTTKPASDPKASAP
jgi:hypothetical protein